MDISRIFDQVYFNVKKILEGFRIYFYCDSIHFKMHSRKGMVYSLEPGLMMASAWFKEDCELLTVSIFNFNALVLHVENVDIFI